jgi:hypothetical protein
MAGATRTTIQTLLKEVYLPGVNRQVNDEVLLLKRLESSSESITEGLKVVVAVDLGRSAGIGPAREGANLPAAGNQTPNRATYNMKSLYGRGQVTGQSVRSTASNQAAFLRTLKYEADGLQRDLRKDLARQVYGGYDIAGAAAAGGINASAAIAKVSVDNGAASFTLTNDAAIRQGWIYPGMLLDGTADFVSVVANSSGTVLSVNLATSNVTFVADPTGLNAGHFLVRTGSIDTSGNAGVTGVSAIIHSSGAFGGLNPATAGLQQWRSLIDTSGGAFSSDTMHALFNQVRMESGASPSSIITTFGVIRAYFNELQAQVQYVDPMKLEGGFRVLEFMGRPFIGDVDCPLGSVFMIDEDSIRIASQTKGFIPLDEDNSFLHWITGKDAWEWAVVRDMELIASARNSSAKMTGITDAGY